MSGIYNIEHYICDDLVVFELCGSYTCLFQYTLLHNESCEKEARRTDPYEPQEMAIQTHQAFRRQTHQAFCRRYSCHFMQVQWDAVL